MATVNSTAGAERAPSSSLCRSRPSPCVNVSAVSAMPCVRSLFSTLAFDLAFNFCAAGRVRDDAAGSLALLLRNQRIETLVGIGAGLIDGLLVQDQILHRLADELARFRIGDDGVADFGRALRGQHVERGLPLLPHRLLVDPFAVFGIAGDR